MRTDLFRRVGLWVLAALAVAAVMVGEASLQLGGRSAAVMVCLLAPVVWATGLVCSSRWLKRRQGA